jgi:hypothetical protein
MQIQGLIGSQGVGKGADGLFPHGSRPPEPLIRNSSGTNWLLPRDMPKLSPGVRGFALGWFRLVGSGTMLERAGRLLAGLMGNLADLLGSQASKTARGHNLLKSMNESC